MAAHKVKCSVCGEIFDTNKIQAVKSSARRYAHYSCMPNGTKIKIEQKDPNLIELEEYLKKIFNSDFVSPRVRKQLNQYTEEFKYTYDGILKSLKWFFEVQGRQVEETYGIGIVPYVYKQAQEYYNTIALAKIINAEKPIEKYHQKQARLIKIKSPTLEKKEDKFFNLGDE